MTDTRQTQNPPQQAPKLHEPKLHEPKPYETEPLSPAARRALAEAEARRAAQKARQAAAAPEKGGRGGKDPARYGDWEVNGIAVDF